MTFLRSFGTFLGIRVAVIVAVLIAVIFLTFAVFYILPADPAQLACGKPCTPENLQRAHTYMGLDHPWYHQFWDYVWGIVAGRTYGSGNAAVHCALPCFGYSFQQNDTVTDLILDRLPPTFSIALGAAVIWLVVGVVAGVVAALRRGTPLDVSITSLAVAGTALPTYLVGLLGILLFGFTLNVVPVGGYVPLTDDPVQWAWHLVLPWATLALVMAAAYTRVTRSQLVDILDSDFVRAARANGLPERKVVLGHGLRNALIPILTMFALDVGLLLGGAVITETVFSISGLGRLLINAVHTVDLPIIVGITLFSAALVLVANLIVDVVLSLLDPRVRSRKGVPV